MLGPMVTITVCLHFSLQVLKRDIPWETYMTTKLITGTCLQLLRRYDKRPESYRAQLLEDVIIFCLPLGI